MTSFEQVRSALATVANVVDGQSPADADIGRRRGPRTTRGTRRRRTEQNRRISDTGRHMQHDRQSLLAHVADNHKGKVLSQRRQDTLSKTEGNCKGRTQHRRDMHRLSVVSSNSSYAGAKFTGAPSASLLPLPPSHWLTVACVS